MKKCFFCLIAVLAIVTACSVPVPQSALPAPSAVVSVLPSPVPASASAAGPVLVSPVIPATVPASEAPASPSAAATAAAVQASAAPAAVSITPDDTHKAPAESAVPVQPDRPDQPNVSVPKPSVKVPVLYYHSINDTPFGISILSVRTGDFDKQLKYLSEHGYTAIFMNEDPANHKKPVIITLDDGYVDNYQYAYPILEKYGMKATVFVITSAIGTPGYLTADQIHDMKRLVSFQSHTVSHSRLTELGEAQIVSELAQSQKVLEDITHEKVYALCYPYGEYDKLSLSLTSRYYDCAVTINAGIATKILGNYQISRLFVSRDSTLEDFIGALGT